MYNPHSQLVCGLIVSIWTPTYEIFSYIASLQVSGKEEKEEEEGLLASQNTATR
jgi:hypothetical protein